MLSCDHNLLYHNFNIFNQKLLINLRKPSKTWCFFCELHEPLLKYLIIYLNIPVNSEVMKVKKDFKQ